MLTYSATSWTFSNLSATTYTISVTGFDGSGKAIASGTGSADLTSASSQSPNIALSYIFSGSGTGQINLTFDASSSGVTVSSASLTLVDPAGTVSTASLSGSSPTFSYTDSSAAVGSWKMFVKLSGGGKVALDAGTIVVAQNVDTAQTFTVGSGDFNDAYVAVTGLSVSPHAMSVTVGSATGNTGTVTTSLTPSNASNTLVTWSSSDSSIASVDQSGVVTAAGMGGPVTITATSVDNPSAHDSSSVTVYGAVTYDGNGATSGTVPVDGNGYAAGQTVTVAGNTGNLAKTGYAFNGWNTQADGNGTTYGAGATFPMGSAPVTLYAEWVQLFAPTFSTPAGTYFRAQSVTISEETSGATVYYTTDGTAPTTSSTVYTAGTTIPVAVNAAPVTIQAMAVVGTTASAVTSGTYSVVQTAQWARSDSSASSDNVRFSSVAADSSGNIYAVGTVGFGGVSPDVVSFGGTASISYSGGSQLGYAVLVKYNSSGAAQWVQKVTTSGGTCDFSAVTVDSSGNVYVVGDISGAGKTFSFGNGKNAAAINNSFDAVLVKYNSSGLAQWVRPALTTVNGSSIPSWFFSVSLDSSGDVYAGGFISGSSSTVGTGKVYFGNGVTATQTASGMNEVVVKYDSSGNPQWASTVTSAAGQSELIQEPNSVSADSAGNVYAVCNLVSAGTYSFGNGVTATGAGNVLIKYSPSGTALWAISTQAQVAVTDSSGNIWTAANPGLTEYSPSGTEMLSQPTSAKIDPGAIGIDGSGNIYVGGYLNGAGSVGFGGNVYTAGTSTSYNAFLVKYSALGTAQWAQSVALASDLSMFTGLGIDSSANVYAAGWMNGASSFDLGNGVTVTGGASSASNALLVKY